MSLTDFHGYRDGVRWRLLPAGVEIEGSGIARTRGAPATVTSVWETYGEAINEAALRHGVPCQLIVATICTESRGNANAVRFESGYVSDEASGSRISVGLMQTLISTAREVIGRPVNREWVLVARNSIEAGTAYIGLQRHRTAFDPPLVAAAYNAGGLYYQPSDKNRWKLRQFPIGTGAHLDRFIAFFNDAVFVLAHHAMPPAVGLP
jgi:hypothetical protein